MTVSSQLCAFEVCLLCRVWWHLLPSAEDPSPFIHSQLMLFNAQKDTAQGRSATNMSPRTGLSLLLPYNCSQGRAAAWAQAHAGPLLLGSWTGQDLRSLLLWQLCLCPTVFFNTRCLSSFKEKEPAGKGETPKTPFSILVKCRDWLRSPLSPLSRLSNSRTSQDTDSPRFSPCRYG